MLPRDAPEDPVLPRDAPEDPVLRRDAPGTRGQEEPEALETTPEQPALEEPAPRSWRLLPVLLSGAVLAGHFWRSGQSSLVPLPFAALALVLLGKRWSVRAVQAMLLVASCYWLLVLGDLASVRQEMGMPWARLAGILVAVSLGTLASAWILEGWRGWSGRPWPENTHRGGNLAPLAAFLLTGGALALVQATVPRPMLLPERFLSQGGWWAVLGLAAWAAWLTHRLGDPQAHPRWRARAWGLFSLVFFGQLVLGLAGLEQMLMTGELHVPVPAVILGGPLYRGEGLFMITLFGATLLLVGPAWCSWLCYIGAWDNSLARRRALSQAPPGRWLPWLRVGTLAGTVVLALGLRWSGVSGTLAAALALGFGALGVLLMALVSRRAGTLVHCTYYCPLGLVAAVLGRLSPHRLRISEACTACGACTRACRYDALRPDAVARRRPGLSCTLCGDCIPSCRHGAITHHFPGLGPEASRQLLVVLVVSLHAMTLGLARL